MSVLDEFGVETMDLGRPSWEGNWGVLSCEENVDDGSWFGWSGWEVVVG